MSAPDRPQPAPGDSTITPEEVRRWDSRAQQIATADAAQAVDAAQTLLDELERRLASQ